MLHARTADGRLRYRGPVLEPLGYDIEVDAGFMGKQIVSFDLEKVSKDVATAVTSEAWPELEARARAALPSFVDAAVAQAQPAASAEIDRALAEGKKTGMVLVGLLAGAMLIAAWYVGAPAPARRVAA